MNIELIVFIIIPLFTAFLIPLIDILNKDLRKFFIVFSVVLEFLLLFFVMIKNFNHIVNGTLFLRYNLGGWLPPVGINLVMDSLSFYFVFLITLAVILLVFYSIGYIGHHEGKYYVLLFLMWTSMYGLVLTGDLFNFYIFIELLLITSAPLIAFKRNREGTEAAIKYMIYGILGGLFIFVGLIVIYYNIQTLNFAVISTTFNTLNYQTKKLITILFLLGLAIKLGIFPFHFWVAKAQSAAPSPVSALLSGIVEKIYIYAFIRLFWFVFGFQILKETKLNLIIIYLALISSLVGHLFALYEVDLKKMLAYSTIGHLGIIIASLTVNTKLAFIAGLLHVLAHLLMKISLFTTTGYLLQYTPTHLIKDSRGVGYNNRSVFIGFMIAAGGMIGLPPMLGFFSKLLILKTFIKASFGFGIFSIILGSITALIYYFKYINTGYKKIKLSSPDKFRLILSVLYRERLVRDMAMVFVVGIIITGLLYSVLYNHLGVIADLIENSHIYNNLILGG